MEEQGNLELTNISSLPEECISHIISLTSPRDACRCAAASPKLFSAAQSDVVWQKFLPPCWEYIVFNSVFPLLYASMKELYFLLCHSPILVDGANNKSFVLEKISGKICCMLGTGDLSISWDQYSLRLDQDSLGSMFPRTTNYKSVPVTSRFSELTYVYDIAQLLIQARIKRRLLSPNTHYVPYFIYALRFNDVEFPPLLRVSVRFVEDGIEKNVINNAYLDDDFFSQYNEGFHSLERDDGWLEIEMGEFFNGDDHGDDDVVVMSLWEVSGAFIRRLRNGLIVQGVEIRPKVVA